jgi:branched-chain amino acid transport system substrate-binding protein
VNRFREDLGDDAEGIVGPAQWDEAAEIRAEIGPPVEEFARRMRTHFGATAVDYPAAQAYAAGLVTIAAIRAADSLDHNRIRTAFSDLRLTTFFGNFAIDRVTGRQTGHRVLLVQWNAGRKHIIEPEPSLGAGALEFPSGWRVLLGSLEWLWLSRRDEDDADEVNEDER